MLTVNSEWLCAFPTAEVILITLTCQLRRPPAPPHAHTQTCSIHNSVSYPINYARLFFYFSAGG